MNPTATPYVLHRSVQFDMTSAITGRAYRLFVHAPLAPPPPGGYPVLYVTDGNATFGFAASQAELDALSEGGVVVVGVGYPIDAASREGLLPALALRGRDLTASAPNTPPGDPPANPAQYGGADSFFRFLTEELRPVIVGSYRADPVNQTLYGHSLGGLFVLDTLFRSPDSFRGFAASSPSIWWNDQEILAGEAAFARAVEDGATAPRILITVGDLEETPGGPTPPGLSDEAYKARLASARMVGNARDLAGRLSKLKGGPGYAVRSQVFEGEDHNSVMAASIARAVRFARQG